MTTATEREREALSVDDAETNFSCNFIENLFMAEQRNAIFGNFMIDQLSALFCNCFSRLGSDSFSLLFALSTAISPFLGMSRRELKESTVSDSRSGGSLKRRANGSSEVPRVSSAKSL
jgi:hypothetical protein